MFGGHSVKLERIRKQYRKTAYHLGANTRDDGEDDITEYMYNMTQVDMLQFADHVETIINIERHLDIIRLLRDLFFY
ncbi:hypothetical protein IFR04_016022 [Cadophora malorum]|uniref:Uncharacterized protein n=1 Tax=Cadophora malorum TaxID=108018 RepID=A0A8H7T1P6_9HELO|nr:hypothetical protein IFR04_016022 [Cadophora malorum]